MGEGVRVRRRVFMCLLGLAGALVAGSCSVGDLQFRNDHRLDFTAPDARENVELPITIRWSMDDFEPVGLDGSTGDGRGAFAVFVDHAPMPVGKDLDWLGRDIPDCDASAECPSDQQLADRDVYVTTATELTLERLPEPGGRVGKEQHFVNIVLLDGSGRRIGESAWYLPFTTDRREGL